MRARIGQFAVDPVHFYAQCAPADSVADQSTRVKLKTTGLRVPKTNGGYMLLPYPHSSSQFYAEKKERSQCYFTAPFRAIVQSIALYFA